MLLALPTQMNSELRLFMLPLIVFACLFLPTLIPWGCEEFHATPVHVIQYEGPPALSRDANGNWVSQDRRFCQALSTVAYYNLSVVTLGPSLGKFHDHKSGKAKALQVPHLPMSTCFESSVSRASCFVHSRLLLYTVWLVYEVCKLEDVPHPSPLKCS